MKLSQADFRPRQRPPLPGKSNKIKIPLLRLLLLVLFGFWIYRVSDYGQIQHWFGEQRQSLQVALQSGFQQLSPKHWLKSFSTDPRLQILSEDSLHCSILVQAPAWNKAFKFLESRRRGLGNWTQGQLEKYGTNDLAQSWESLELQLIKDKQGDWFAGKALLAFVTDSLMLEIHPDIDSVSKKLSLNSLQFCPQAGCKHSLQYQNPFEIVFAWEQSSQNRSFWWDALAFPQQAIRLTVAQASVICSPFSGRIEWVGEDSLVGRWFRLDQGSQRQLYFGGVRFSPLVVKGAAVKLGDTLGWASASHLPAAPLTLNLETGAEIMQSQTPTYQASIYLSSFKEALPDTTFNAEWLPEEKKAL